MTLRWPVPGLSSGHRSHAAQRADPAGAGAASGDEKERVAKLVKSTEPMRAWPTSAAWRWRQRGRRRSCWPRAGMAHLLPAPWPPRVQPAARVLDGLTNLAMVTGHYGRLAYLGLDANSQGCRDMGVLPDRLPGHAALDNAEARSRLAEHWGTEIPTTAGKATNRCWWRPATTSRRSTSWAPT
ncbi:MAG: hypothetical protein R2838_04625 [Caldilineaceae bacterium]